jgi:hypothetical protein
MQKNELRCKVQALCCRLRQLADAVMVGSSPKLNQMAYQVIKGPLRELENAVSDIEMTPNADETYGVEFLRWQPREGDNMLQHYLNECHKTLSGMIDVDADRVQPVWFEPAAPEGSGQPSDFLNPTAIGGCEGSRPMTREQRKMAAEQLHLIADGLEHYGRGETSEDDSVSAGRGSAQETIEQAEDIASQEWSAPMSKDELARRYLQKHDARWREIEKTMTGKYEIDQVAARKIRVRLDNMDRLTRQKIERPFP